MEKNKSYIKLVEKRKKYRFNDGLTNPSQTDFDIDELDPWAQWQNNLNAKILVIGQEYCDVQTYNKTKSLVERFSDRYEYPANKNLKEYFDLLGYDIGHPLFPNKENDIFFTNAVMGLKDGTMSANFKVKWLTESREEFLIPLIELIKPTIIITIGAMATKSVGKIYNFKVSSHKNMVNNSPIKIKDILIFPVYHIGGLGLSNRSKKNQIEDWKKIKNWL